MKFETEQNDQEKVLKSFEIDNEFYRKKYKNLNEKNVLLIITENLIGSGSAIGTSTKSLPNPSTGVVLNSPTADLTSMPISITNEYIIK